MSLTIQVEKVQFDPDTCVLRLSGKNKEKSEFVQLGVYHTLDLEMNRKFSIEKSCWDQVHLDRLEEACNPERQVEEGKGAFVRCFWEVKLANVRSSYAVG